MTDNWPDRLGVWWIAEDHPELPAVVYPESDACTYGELTGRANEIVHLLRGLGVKVGDAVAVILPNGVALAEWSMACHQAGWYFLPLNYHLSAVEVGAIVEHSEAAVLVVDESFASLAASVRDHAGASTARPLMLGGEAPGFEAADRLLSDQPTSPPNDRRPGSVFVYTSGTTGAPKGIRRPPPPGDPWALANEAAVFSRAFAFEPMAGRHLVAAAMHHVGTHSFYMGALNAGQALVIMPKFDAEECLRLIEQYQVTTAYLVPTMFHRLLQLPDDVRARYDHSSLRTVVHAAAPCPRPVKERMMDWWGPVIWETYGGSEGAATIAKPHRWLEKPGTVGRAVRGVEVTILDDDGAQLPPGEAGNVYIDTGPRAFEYHGNDELTESAYRGRKFTLGDIGYLDDDGYLFIRDRAKDMIISGGVNVFPAEIESALTAHPGVGDVAVIGVPSDEWGEEVKAVVTPAPGVASSPELADELITFCRDRMAHYKCPRSVDFRDDLPRTDAGKLYKRLIRDDYWTEADRQV